MRRLGPRPNPTRARMIRLINQISRNAGSIMVRDQIDGEWVNVPLIEMPTHLAIQHVCQILLEGLQQGTSGRHA